jgi:excisionase family DNA binding protein
MPKLPDLDRLQLLGTREAAKLLSVTPGTLLKLGADGTIPAPVRLGRNLVRWRLRDILAVVKRGEARE